MLDHFSQTDDAVIADCTAKACALVSGFGGDEKLVTKLVDVSAAGEDVSHRKWGDITIGLVDYRAGRFGPAAEIIIRSAPSSEGSHRDAQAFSILAMAQHRLGKVDEARTASTNAQRIISTKMPKLEKGETFGDDWQDWLHAQILAREAEDLLKITDKKLNTNPQVEKK